NTNIENHANFSFNIYPNPFDNEINIFANNINKVSIYNSIGQVVYQIMQTGNQIKVETTKFEHGVYFVEIITSNDVIIKKLIKD
ncbi:MAG: T9SS type A sorting domain-containing protein, partial [Bacteroidetes bacterium]|nr:T9SS type A sorting domain-containing protein [Bacteroidota bacterium]